MLKKINDTINNSLDTIWCMFYEKDERVATKVDFDMEDINRLTGIVRNNETEHTRSMRDLRSLMNRIENKIKLLNEKLYNVRNISKNEIISLKKQLRTMLLVMKKDFGGNNYSQNISDNTIRI